ncbi:Sensory neuron membrane protein 2 [Caenorhabditis elegans]|uniref:Sensory neuron membrane protein 2 n=1 Tax=Caenorhabditis elegans TaxID=6239 RepID=Q9XTT3_CAEEL|nr:SCAVenger receptor (CD36 family) related [Caenorhabditis elegans]CAB11566.3 SCAVenger receptor (CD36 family) related [Caenorhabditis elegans]|eukprot:NP_499625.2 SCAVenger receptor (CD36 family) related [Caenorhabditis elegans]
MLKKAPCLFGSAIILGLLLAAAGVLLLIGIPIDRIVNRQVIDQDFLGYTRDENGTEVPNAMTKSWLKPLYAMQLNIWMFNVTNVDGILKRHEKPNLHEIGPFVFDEVQEKVYHRFADNDTRVFYKNQKLYHFNKNASCPTCHLDMKVTIPNIVFQKLIDAADVTIFGVRIKFAIESVLKMVSEAPYITVKVSDALFDGYEDPIIDIVCKNKILQFLCETNSLQRRVGFFYGQNGTTDGIYEVDAGVPSPSKIGHLYTWNNMTEMPEGTWDTKYARMINGTDGQLFSPMLKREDRLTIFVPQICRSIQMEYTKDVAVNGVPSWRYAPPLDLYDPALPQNRAFCNKNGMPRYFDNTTVQIENCLPAGLIDLSRCQAGNPRVYLSNPHFYNSPMELWHSVTGLSVPTASNDLTVVDIEPTAGVPTQAKRIMQINVGMVKGSLSVTENTTNVVVPVLWMNETAYFDQGTRDQLINIFNAKHYSFIGGVISLSLGLIAWLAVFVVIIVYSRQSDEEEYGRLVLEDEDEEPAQDENAVLA